MNLAKLKKETLKVMESVLLIFDHDFWAVISVLGLSAVSYAFKVTTRGGAVVVFFGAAGGYLAFGASGIVYVATILVATGLATRYKYNSKARNEAAEANKGSRNFWRVLGGGGAAGVIAWLTYLGIIPSEIGVFGFVAGLAVTNSDTWATEIGATSRTRPRRLTPPWPEVDIGVSGAVSPKGELAAFAGALLAVFVSYILELPMKNTIELLILTASAVIIGEHVDSLLGATTQESYYCTKCQKLTDRRIHRCGEKTKLYRGSPLISNTAVNLISSSVGACLCMFLAFVVL
jgi:uncharacterized protein (TIGR00297 family)